MLCKRSPLEERCEFVILRSGLSGPPGLPPEADRLSEPPLPSKGWFLAQFAASAPVDCQHSYFCLFRAWYAALHTPFEAHRLSPDGRRGLSAKGCRTSNR